ncbi:MAG TPA: flagellar filament capping protein FliD, partial [Clostridia bacterium]|nr:flagellar filament capping protein FliD [Clostridia bacterium]
VEGNAASAPLQSGILPQQENSEGSGKFLELKDHSMTITVDGVTKVITLNGDYGKFIEDENTVNYGDLVQAFQNEINSAFGHDRVTVEMSEDGYHILLKADTSTITVMEHTDKLGFGTNASNRINLDSTLLGLEGRLGTPLELDGDENSVNFTINGENFSFSGNDTLRTVMSRINNSKAGVTITYSSLTDKFVISNKNTGAAQALTFGDEGGSNFLKAIGIESENIHIQDGEDAMMEIDEMTVYRSSNNFTIDGVTYNLNQELKVTDEPISLTMSQDVDQAFDNIKSFIESYNKIIDTINGTLSEEVFRDFRPLTDGQRGDMSDKEAELWEEKARSGLLNRDPILQKIVYDMRRALVESVEGAGISLSSIGITTGSYMENGRLHIDESKLKTALRENGDQVAALFNSKSDISYSPDSSGVERQERYRTSGLVHRLSDILQDNIRTRRDVNGNKGILLEKAGIVGDASEKANLMDDQLKAMGKRIDDALSRMLRAENRYWAQFTALEAAMQRMSSQSLWLEQQLGGGMY